MDSQQPEIIVLKFADSAIPKFKELRGKDYIQYGDDNAYPEYLTYLFNKSAKHNAIIGGKANYIFGKGYENGNIIINRLGETLNDISRKCILDVEIYGGFRLEIIWDRVGRIGEVYHTDYNTIRLAKDGGYYFSEKWEKYCRDDAEYIPAFNPKYRTGSQLYAYNEYRPGIRFYPLPSYIGCNNWIETDIEISKFGLSSMKNGMAPSKLIQFYIGDPGEEKKKEIERAFTKKFSGTENSGKYFIAFNPGGKDKQITIDDISGSELDKMYIEISKAAQSEIFSGHGITSPMLFGIKTEGQLGGTTELKTAYEIFINTYAEPKATAFDREINYLLTFSAFPRATYKITHTDPIGLQFDVKDVIGSIPKEFILEKLGVPKELWGAPTTPALPASGSQEMVNDAIRNLTGRQHQAVMRIIRQYGQGKVTLAQARTLLRTGYGLGEDDINLMLGLDEQPLAMSNEDSIIAMFDECGDSKGDYEIIKSKAAFSTDDEDIWIAEAFKTYDVTASEGAIIELIKKDPKITAAVIAQAINQTEAYVESKIKSLIKRGYIESTTEMIGVDEILVRTVPKSNITIPPTGGKTNPAQISIKYSYEPKPGLDPIIATTRPFCKKMIQLNRLYSRADIEKISERLGYSVFDRKGGFWGSNPECRHRWESHLVVKKGGNLS